MGEFTFIIGREKESNLIVLILYYWYMTVTQQLKFQPKDQIGK